MPLVPGQVIRDRYRVVALLHHGGMGTVYEVMDSVLNIRCALKEMVPYPGTPGTALPQLREQFQQEAQLLAGLRHPNLTRVSDHFEDDGNAYLVMDFVNGKGLDEVIAEEGRLAEDKVLGWAAQLIQALAHCHEHGVIHRDVKPQNVMITWQGQAMLVDFGLAKLVDPDDPRTRTVMQGLGTPEYAPPEQYHTKQGRTDPRTDIYSLGATLYHALVGQPPPTVSERVVDPEVLVPVREFRDDVSEATDRALMKALALRPSERFQGVGRMYYALFGSPLPRDEVAGRVTARMGRAQSAGSPDSTVMLPWLTTAGLKIGRRLRLGLAALGLVGLVATLLLVLGRVNMGSARTAALALTPSGTATGTATATSTATSTPTATRAAAVAPTSAILVVTPPAARLELTGSDDPDPVASGALLTYTLAYTNAGDGAATGVIVADALDPDVAYVGASITPTRRTTATLSWDVGTLAPAVSGEILISVTVPCGLARSTVLTNTATLEGDGTAPLSVTQTTLVSGVGPACFVPTATPTPTLTPIPTSAPRRPTRTPTSTPEPTDTATPPPTATPTPTRPWAPSSTPTSPPSTSTPDAAALTSTPTSE